MTTMANGLIYLSISLALVFQLHGSVKGMYLDNRNVRHFSVQDDPYLQQRTKLLTQEGRERIGAYIDLSQKELRANDILMNFKRKEINDSRVPFGKPFAPSLHFFKGKSIVENSEVFKIIKKMPKGGALHLHDISLVDINWLVKNVTYMPNSYMCRDTNNSNLNYHFFQNPPTNPGCPWKLISSERKASGNVSRFDQMLYDSMSLIVEDPLKAYPTIDHVWKQFLHVFDVANGLVNFAPVFEKYFYEALNEFNEDNVQYIEVRGLLPETYDLQGNTNGNTWAMQTYANTFNKFVREHPEFTGGKIIYSGLRFVDPAEVLKEVQQSMLFMTQFPDHFAGYDLVGQEDPGKTLLYYINELQYPSRQNPPFKLPYFFHAGETDWEGTPTDNNLIDAVLMNATRIGHGYALPKHPQVMKLVKQHDIAVEVNPISNQVLMLVEDLRNHPAAALISQGFPVVISADDPSVWGARGLSHDFYMAFMGLTGEDADLKVLKQLALNSLKYSALAPTHKQAAINDWENKWNKFIDIIIGTYQPVPAGK